MAERRSVSPAPPPAGDPPGAAPPEPACRLIALTDGVLDSGVLFGAARSIRIAHRGETYRLRLTARDRLILTK